MRFRIPRAFASMFDQRRKWPGVKLPGLPVVQTGIAPARLRRQHATNGRLTETVAFGHNPGDLRMLEYVPAHLPASVPLVVVLHGCGQTAAEFDRAAGWTRLAREHGFAVLYPEQRSRNNPNLCFNWFRPSAVRRDRGEVMSIRQMIDSMCDRHGIDLGRIYVQGLSAGGAMASALLATYPDLFAGGDIVAGLPYGAARDAMGALSVMKSGVRRSPREWGDLVRHVSPDVDRFPAVSIWHGLNDNVVSLNNAHASMHQWLDVHGLHEADGVETARGKKKTRRWQDENGRSVIEFHTVSDMGHGFPVKRLSGASSSASTSRFMLDIGICAATDAVKRWKIG